MNLLTRTRSRRARLLSVALAIVIGVTVSACGQNNNDTRSATAGLPDLGQSLAAHEWLLDAADSTLASTGPNPVTLVFGGEDSASGVAGCNTYRARVDLSGDDGVQLAEISKTQQSCEPNVMSAEQAYLDALTQVRTADVTDRDRLVLTSSGVRLSFTAFDIETEIVADWKVVNLRTANGVETLIGGTTATATFADDRSAVLTTGCNTLRSSWTLDGGEITFELPAQTMMSCDDPPGIMEQEAALSGALAAASAIDLTPTTLTLHDSSGEILLVAQRD